MEVSDFLLSDSRSSSPLLGAPKTKIKDLCKFALLSDSIVKEDKHSKDLFESEDEYLPKYLNSTCEAIPVKYDNTAKDELFSEPVPGPSSCDRVNLYQFQSDSNSQKMHAFHTVSDSDDDCLPLQKTLSQPLPLQNGICYDNHEVPLSQPTPSSKPRAKRKAIRKNDEEVLERKRQKETKMKEKENKAALVEKVRRMKPGECLKYVTAIINETFPSSAVGQYVMPLLKEDLNFKFKINDQHDPDTITWTRQEADSLDEKEEMHILYIWNHKQIINHIESFSLLDKFKEVKCRYRGYKIYIGIYGLNRFFRTRQKNSKPNEKEPDSSGISRYQVECVIDEVEAVLGVSSRMFDDIPSIAQMIKQLTKSVAEINYVQEKEKLEYEKSYYATGDSRNCVRVNEEWNGLLHFWVQALAQLNLSTIDIAKSIAEVYPSPLSLHLVYNQMESEKEKELLLQNITIKKKSGKAVGRTKIGPELSKKIYSLFTGLQK